MSASRIALVCFDMAGTTVLDDGAVEGAFLDALVSLGIQHDDPKRELMLDYVRETMGTSKITVFRSLFPTETEAQSANLAFEAAYAARLARGEVSEIPGALRLITHLRAEGIQVALLTGFSAATRDLLVAALGWERAADLLVCPAEAGRGRPYPDMVLHALLRLKIDDVADVAVLGDSAADVTSGLRSGASIVAGVLSGADSSERLRAAGATHVLESIAELPDLLGIPLF